MACGSELKLFGCAIPLRRERSGGKDIVAAAAEEEATTSGICIAEAAAAAVIHIRDGGGGKVRKEGVSANTQVQPSHLLVLPLPEDNDDGEEQEEEILTTGGAAIISDNDDNNDNNGSDINSNKDNRKVMKKPEKLLPCPRCKSLNTKFCYFNNGNANQPRHFCRGCQRYWTAGGALRNVPVGSGRRKSKFSSFSSSSSTSHPLPHHYPPCPVVNRTDGASARSDMADSAQCSLPPQGAVLPTAVIGRRLQMGCSIQDSYKPSKSSSSFGLMSVEDGIEMMTPLDEQSAANGGTTTTNASNEWNGSSNGGGVGETYPGIDEYACGSSEQQPSTIVGGSGGEGYMGNSPPFGFPMQPWPFGYGLFGFSPMLNSNQSSSLTPPLAGWCAPPWMGGAGGGMFPWPLMPVIPPWPPWGITPPPMVGAGFTPPCSSSSPLALGKHSREGLSQHTASGKDGCPVIPKTLRTREPREAAQSSIWSALGLDNNHNHNYNNHNNNSPVSAFGIFKGFPPKTKEKDGADEMQEPHVNPAARTRSMGFHENS